MEITAISNKKRHLKHQIEKIHGDEQEKELREYLLGARNRIGSKLSDIFRREEGFSCRNHPNKNHDNGNNKQEKDKERFGRTIINGDFRKNGTE